MAEATFLEQKSIRPGSAAVVILMHGVALAAVLLAKSELIDKPATRTVVVNVKEPRPLPPPDVPQHDTPPPPRDQLVIYTPPTPLPPRPNQPSTTDIVPRDTIALDALEGERQISEPVPLPQPRPEPVPPPVRVEAQLASRGDLQPPYPASEQRAEREGRVVIRVTIGTNGRVVSTAKVSATSDAFYEVTERHARARWRFRPTTVDGRPIESQKTMTVHFQLDG